MGKLTDAAKNGGKRETLIALRDVTAATIEDTTSGRDVAALSKRLMEIIEAIEAMPDPGGDVNPVDALASAIAEYDADEDGDGGGD